MFSANYNSEIENEEPYIMYGDCRCCMAKGQHRDVTKEYYYNNIKEVYKEIFLECFNFSLTPHNRISPLICEDCVHRLRDAASFRMMVAATEEQLLNAVVFKSDPDDNELVDVSGSQSFTTEVKIENDADNLEPDDDDWSDNELVIDETREHVSSDSDDIYIIDDSESAYSSITTSTTSAKDDEPREVLQGESMLVARFSSSAQPLPKLNELPKICPGNERLKDLEGKTADKVVKPKSIEWYFKTPLLKDKSMSDREALAVNATTLFQYSNATAFKTKTRNGYPCFYCREVYTCDKLREHQETHTKASIYGLLTKYNADEFVVNADITDLKCTICNKNINDLNELRHHLSEEHSKKIYASADRVIPFRLKETEYDCQICGTKFETFGKVEKHMNTHFGTFKCEACGAGFVTKHRLGVHNYTQHKDEKVICDVCKKSFRNQMKYRLHYEGVHKNMKKFKCMKCPEKFIDYFTRQKHLVDAHGEPPLLYKCHICDKGFNRRYALTSHVKRLHLTQKNIKCEKCPYQCYTNSELKDHMIKHGAKQALECPICKKTYGRNRTLAMHIKSHNDD